MVKAKHYSISDTSRVKITRRISVPYPEIIDDVKNHKATFVQIKRQTANAAAKKLSKELGYSVVSYSAVHDGTKGYIFMREEDVDRMSVG